MATFFRTDLGTTSAVSLDLEPVNLGDSNVYFRITGTENYELQPSTKVRAMIAPTAASVSSTVASGLLSNSNSRNITESGYYFAEGGQNNTSLNDWLSFDYIKIDREWENQEFDLHWLISRGSDALYGSNISQCYSLPHNVQTSEISLSGNLKNIGNQIEYNVKWSGIYNDTSVDYGSSPADGPYRFNVVHKYGLNRQGYVEAVSGFLDGASGYAGGTMSSGITFTLPFFDARKEFQEVPAIYNFQITNVSAGPRKYGSSTAIVTVDHQKLFDSNNYFKNLDNYAFTHATKEKLKKVDEVKIESNVINRKRLSIGINDISIKNNTYVKQGIYISKPYALDFNIYTFSFKVDEFIPEYPGLDPYQVVQYFMEFNSNQWERISPINRKDEQYNNVLIPKMFIFDKSPEEEIQGQVKYITYNSNVNLFRVKIVFDLSNLTESKFTPPEIRDYKCIIYDKDQFFNI